MAVSSYITGALLLGQMAHEPYSVESYILTTGWMFTCFILGASFTAELASFLAAEKEEALVSSLVRVDCWRGCWCLSGYRVVSPDRLWTHLPLHCTKYVPQVARIPPAEKGVAETNKQGYGSKRCSWFV